MFKHIMWNLLILFYKSSVIYVYFCYKKLKKLPGNLLTLPTKLSSKQLLKVNL